MDDKIITMIKVAYERFIGTGMYFCIFVIAIIYIFTHIKKEEKSNATKIKIVLCFYSIIVFLLNINPIFAKIMEKVNGESVYWRVYWLLPLAITIPFFFTEYIYQNKKTLNKIVIAILCVFVLMISGKNIYTEENFAKVNNYYKIPDDVLDIIKIASADDEEYKKLAGPLEFEIYTRQYDGTIILAEPRSFSGTYSPTSIVTYLNAGEMKKVYNKAKEIKCNYVVMNHSSEKPNDNLVNYGFEVIGRNSTYTLYKLDEINNK